MGWREELEALKKGAFWMEEPRLKKKRNKRKWLYVKPQTNCAKKVCKVSKRHQKQDGYGEKSKVKKFFKKSIQEWTQNARKLHRTLLRFHP